jgi:protein-tyrosine-phosphatase/DNA-binding transcriptional ArsR family regulator
VDDIATRAARHAALSEPLRLAIVDELVFSDRAPGELLTLLEVPSNLLAHHLDVLEDAGLITRHRSSGDGRRRYVHLERSALHGLTPGRRVSPSRAMFICTHNSARSQLAAALWQRATGLPALSAGTQPAGRVHPGAVASAERDGLDLSQATPHHLDEVGEWPELVITVCDRAHEELGDGTDRLHWSIADPVPAGTRKAFDAARDEIAARIDDLVAEPSR